MSESERWVAVRYGYDWIVEAEGKEVDENFVADCGASGSYSDAEDYAKRIVADHNGCIGIEDPKITVPELVAACRDLIADYNNCISASEFGDGAAAEEMLERIKAVLAKTGQKPVTAPPSS